MQVSSSGSSYLSALVVRRRYYETALIAERLCPDRRIHCCPATEEPTVPAHRWNDSEEGPQYAHPHKIWMRAARGVWLGSHSSGPATCSGPPTCLRHLRNRRDECGRLYEGIRSAGEQGACRQWPEEARI